MSDPNVAEKLAANDDMKKCEMADCGNQGKPQDGFDFYVCDSCLMEFGRLLNKLYEKSDP